MASSSPSKIPVVDFSNWRQASKPDRLKAAKEITSACGTLGCVYIVNHAISPEVLDEAISWSQKFFDLPSEEKCKAPQSDNPSILRGYSSQFTHGMDYSGNNLREVTDYKVISFLIFSWEVLEN